MTPIHSSTATKKLALKFVLDNIDYRKRCLYLQEIIGLGRINNVWLKVLNTFLSTPPAHFKLDNFSLN